MKIFLWLLFAACSGAVGFYVGLGQGAKNLSYIAAQNEVGEALTALRQSLDVLASNDTTASSKLHEKNVSAALIKLGSYSKGLAYWRCSDKDRETVAAARKYNESHPEISTGPLQSIYSEALAFCSTN